ncbi:MAG: diaminopimelate epimerase [Rickettsiales bacterium]|nr:diaminopimelate epimerase [Rickettsiales bacterium]
METLFLKMHGAGNDFVVLDARHVPLSLSVAQLSFMADRHLGIGCDQIIVMEHSTKADLFMRIYNADGSESSACGNATRCVAWLVMEETRKHELVVETRAGLLTCKRAGPKLVTVNMGAPRWGWQEIPLSEERDTLHLGIGAGDCQDPVGVSMGNPHAVFVVPDIQAAAVTTVGPVLEHHALFPERANIGFAQVVSPSQVLLRVWERGTGETLACGSGACAALVALNRRGLVNDEAEIHVQGGILTIRWDKASNQVWKTGPVALSFNGVMDV